MKYAQCEYKGKHGRCSHPAKWVLESEDKSLPKKRGNLHCICTQHRNLLVPDLLIPRSSPVTPAVKPKQLFEIAAPARKVLWQ